MKKIISVLMLLLSPINKSIAAITIKLVASEKKIEESLGGAHGENKNSKSNEFLYQYLNSKQKIQSKESSEGTDCRDTRTPNG